MFTQSWMIKQFYSQQFNSARVICLHSALMSNFYSTIRVPLGATILGHSGPGSDVYEGVLRISRISRITGSSPSDCLVSYQGHLFREGFLLLSRDTVGVLYSPSRLGRCVCGCVCDTTKTLHYGEIFYWGSTLKFYLMIKQYSSISQQSCISEWGLWGIFWSLTTPNHPTSSCNGDISDMLIRTIHPFLKKYQYHHGSLWQRERNRFTYSYIQMFRPPDNLCITSTRRFILFLRFFFILARHCTSPMDSK